MLRRIVIGALAAGAFLAVSSTAASANTWEDGGDNVGNAHSPASIVIPVLNHALNGNEVDVLTVAHLERINLNLLTNNTSLNDVEGRDG